MPKRYVEVKLCVGFGNGDEGIYKVVRLPIPKYISSMKSSDRDDALAQHALWVTEWVKKAIHRKEQDDEYFGIMDSW